MTDLEREALSTLEEIIEHFAAGRHVSKWTYMEVMGHARDTVRHLQNLASGCPTGTHLVPCTCVAAIPGRAKYVH